MKRIATLLTASALLVLCLAAFAGHAGAESGLVRYIIRVVDQTGAPVEGAFLNICTDVLCDPRFTDADGTITFESEKQNYHLQFILVPDGYAVAGDFELYTKDATELTIGIARTGLPDATPTDTAEAPYTVMVVDQNGLPVPGVQVKICTDDVCQLLATDERGEARFTGAVQDYHVTILFAPEGIAFSGEEHRTGDQTGITLRVTRE